MTKTTLIHTAHSAAPLDITHDTMVYIIFGGVFVLMLAISLGQAVADRIQNQA